MPASMAFPDTPPVTPPPPGGAAPSAAEAAAGLAEAFGAADPGEPLDAKGRAAVLYRIRMLMEFWGITPAELGDAGTPDPATAPPAPAAALPPKVRHPVSGQTWDGQGPQPQWLRDALLKEGYTPQQLRDAVHQAGEAGTAA
jgi:DNA-binding protein H-NS